MYIILLFTCIIITTTFCENMILWMNVILCRFYALIGYSTGQRKNWWWRNESDDPTAHPTPPQLMGLKFEPWEYPDNTE